MEVLLAGYIRDIESKLDYQQIIPQAIYDICLKYFFSIKILFFWSEKSDGIHCLNLDNHQKKWNLSIRDINCPQNTRWTKKLCVRYSGLLHESNVTFPSQFTNRINTSFALTHDNYHSQTTFDLLIRAGGNPGTDNMEAIILKEPLYDQIKQDKNQQIALKWDLPSNVKTLEGGSVVWLKNETYCGLISIGGYAASSHTNIIKYLSFKCANVSDENEFHWNRSLIAPMPEKKAFVASTMIGKCNFEKIFVATGSAEGQPDTNKVVYYDFDLKKWMNVANNNKAKNCAGIFYNSFDESVYLGGGYPTAVAKTVEKFDINKNVWVSLANTKFSHDDYPMVWLEETDQNMLYIASVDSQMMEMLDLRENKSWIEPYGRYCDYNENLIRMFDAKSCHGNNELNSTRNRFCK